MLPKFGTFKKKQYLRPTPPCFQQGPLRRYSRILRCIHKQMGVFLPVLRTPFSVRLYAAFMLAYAAYRRPQNIELHSIRQKNTHFLAYVQFLLYLCSRNDSR